MRVCASVCIHTSVVAQTQIECAVREPLPWHEGPCLRLMHLLGAQGPLRALTSGDTAAQAAARPRALRLCPSRGRPRWTELVSVKPGAASVAGGENCPAP